MRQADAASDDVEKHVPWICRQITQGIWPKLYRVMLDMDRFGGNAERQPWADVVRQVGDKVS